MKTITNIFQPLSPMATSTSFPYQYYSHYIDNFSTGFLNDDQNSQMVPLTSSCEMTNYNSPVSVVSFAEQFDVSESIAVPVMSGLDMTYYDFEQRESYCNGLVPNLWSDHQRTFDTNWGLQENSATNGHEEPEIKVGRYSAEEKKDRILRYMKKRNQRNFNKTIKYACRKTLADKRVRIRGRFAKNQEPCDDEIVKKGCDYSSQQESSFYNDTFQMKFDGDELWQAAMGNLVHFPYTTSS